MQVARDSIRQSSFDEATLTLLEGIYDEVLDRVPVTTPDVAFAIADALSIMAGVGQKSPDQLKRYAISHAHSARFDAARH
jgi:hypothetical protein